MDLPYGHMRFGLMSIGVIIGIAIGVAFDNAGIGIISGICIGVFLSVKFSQKFRPDSETVRSGRGKNDN